MQDNLISSEVSKAERVSFLLSQHQAFQDKIDRQIAMYHSLLLLSTDMMRALHATGKVSHQELIERWVEVVEPLLE